MMSMTAAQTKELPATPRRTRRATVSTRSPEPAKKEEFDLDLDEPGSPSKRKEKCKSYGNLLQSKIAPVSLLELQLKQCKLCLYFHEVEMLIAGVVECFR